jgi:hypothetical protein
MAVLTVSEVKTLLLIPANNTKYDDYLTTLIPMVESFVKQYCNRDFLNADTGELDYPDGLKIVMAQLIRYHIKENQTQLEGFRGNNNMMLPLYPPDLLTALNQWRRIRYVAFKEDI